MVSVYRHLKSKIPLFSKLHDKNCVRKTFISVLYKYDFCTYTSTLKRKYYRKETL